MKKIFLTLAFISSAMVFAQASDNDYEKGYKNGYYSIAHKTPAVINGHASTTFSLQRNETATMILNSDEYNSEALQKKNAPLSTTDQKAFTEGYEAGKRYAMKDISEDVNKQ